jgi:hypothetical protein
MRRVASITVAVLATLCATGLACADVIVTSTFNPGGFLTNPNFNYFFNLNGVGQFPATDVTIALDTFTLNGNSLVAVSPDNNVTATFAAGPPESITLVRKMGTFMVGDGAKINSGSVAGQNAKIVGLANALTWSGLAPGQTNPPTSKAPPPPPPLKMPKANPAKVGALDISGSDATPGSFVTIFQSDQFSVLLGQVQVDSGGFFDVPLSSPLNGEDFFVGVSGTNSNVPDGGTIVDEQTPVPEPFTFLLLATCLIGLVGYRWQRHRRA